MFEFMVIIIGIYCFIRLLPFMFGIIALIIELLKQPAFWAVCGLLVLVILSIVLSCAVMNPAPVILAGIWLYHGWKKA